MVGYRRGEWAVNNLDFGYVGLQRLNGNKDSVVLKVDSAIQRINHYPTDNSIGSLNYPEDSYLSFAIHAIHS